MAWNKISLLQMAWMAGVRAVEPVIAVPCG
jgi:hypothetical protein